MLTMAWQFICTHLIKYIWKVWILLQQDNRAWLLYDVIWGDHSTYQHVHCSIHFSFLTDHVFQVPSVYHKSIEAFSFTNSGELLQAYYSYILGLCVSRATTALASCTYFWFSNLLWLSPCRKLTVRPWKDEILIFPFNCWFGGLQLRYS